VITFVFLTLEARPKPIARAELLGHSGLKPGQTPVMMPQTSSDDRDHELAVVRMGQDVPNARLCKEMLDRLTDQANIIETGNESYRFRERWRKKATGKCFCLSFSLPPLLPLRSWCARNLDTLKFTTAGQQARRARHDSVRFADLLLKHDPQEGRIDVETAVISDKS
jgi:hypothetical protein